MKNIGIVFALLTGLFFSYSPTAHSDDVTAEVIGKFRNTYYYVALEEAYGGVPEVPILDMKGNTLAIVSKRYKRALDIEGSGRLRDGRVVNYAGRINRKVRYHVTIHPYGRGAGDCALIPYFTVAVDRRVIPLGTVVQIDETVGMLLPDGSRHSGLWRAEDTGGAIKKDRIDLFVGDGDDDTYLKKAGIKHLQALTLRKIADPPKDNCVDRPPR